MKAEAVSTKQEAERTDTLIREIPLARISESKTNPRSHFDEAAMTELAVNIEQHGVLQPVLLRPHPNGESGVYELVAWARRFRHQSWHSVKGNCDLPSSGSETIVPTASAVTASRLIGHVVARKRCISSLFSKKQLAFFAEYNLPSDKLFNRVFKNETKVGSQSGPP